MRLKIMRNYRQRKFANRIMGGRKLRAADTNGLKILVDRVGDIDVYEDDFEQGELKQINSFEFNVKGQYNSAEELSDFMLSEGVLYTSDTVDENLDRPSDYQERLWRNGKLMLYSANLRLPVKVVSDIHEMTYEEADMFGFDR